MRKYKRAGAQNQLSFFARALTEFKRAARLYRPLRARPAKVTSGSYKMAAFHCISLLVASFGLGRRKVNSFQRQLDLFWGAESVCCEETASFGRANGKFKARGALIFGRACAPVGRMNPTDGSGELAGRRASNWHSLRPFGLEIGGV